MKIFNFFLVLLAFISFNACQQSSEIFTDFSDVAPVERVTAADLGLKTYRVKKGKHDFTPNAFPLPQKASRFGFYAAFTERTKYNLGNADQLDYNKLGGASFNFVNHLVDAFILGWRYNGQEDVFEVVDYWHKDKGRFIGADNRALPVAKLKANEVFAYWWEIKESEVVFHLKTPGSATITRSFPLAKRGKNFKEIGAWFGGTSAAPADLELHNDRITNWVNNAPGF